MSRILHKNRWLHPWYISWQFSSNYWTLLHFFNLVFWVQCWLLHNQLLNTLPISEGWNCNNQFLLVLMAAASLSLNKRSRKGDWVGEERWWGWLATRLLKFLVRRMWKAQFEFFWKSVIVQWLCLSLLPFIISVLISLMAVVLKCIQVKPKSVKMCVCICSHKQTHEV